jgi:hypothetical protein
MIQTEIQQGVGRAKNAVQDYLIRKLLYPKVYLDAEFNGVGVDVLAIDRAGTGDVHAVKIVYQGSDTENAMETVVANIVAPPPPSNILPHFIYAAVVRNRQNAGKYVPSEQIIQRSLAEDGVGRMGILYVDLNDDDPSVKVILKAERFRSSKEIVELAHQYVASHTANWEVFD